MVASRTHTSTVLCVDDEPQVLRALRRDLRGWLEKHGLELQSATSGQECLDILEDRHEEVCIVISDLRMPSIKGSDLLATIGDRYPDIGLVLLTAYSDMEEITKAIRASISELILKPWDPNVLPRTLENTLDYVRAKRNSKRYYQEIQQQLQTAGEFQRALLAHDTPHVDGVQLEIQNSPAEGLFVSGDYYDTLLVDDDRLLMLLGDVSGHGIRPALVTALLKLLTRRIVAESHPSDFSPAGLLSQLNNALPREMPGIPDVFVSCAAIHLDLTEGVGVAANAGHPPPVVIGPRGRFSPASHGPALGFRSDITYRDEPFHLEEEQRVLLYSDGLYHVGPGQSSGETHELLEAIFAQADRTAPPFFPALERILGAGSVLVESNQEQRFPDDVTIMTAKIHSLSRGK